MKLVLVAPSLTLGTTTHRYHCALPGSERGDAGVAQADLGLDPAGHYVDTVVLPA